MSASRRRIIWFAWLGAGLGVLLTAGAGCALWGGEAVLLLRELQAGPSATSPTELKPSENMEQVAYAAPDGQVQADLHLPPEGTAEAALVLVAGAVRQGKDDPRAVHFARTLAGAGFAVLSPDIESIRTFRLSAADAEPVAAAVHYLEGRAGELGYRNIGLVGISYALGPAVLAALRPDMRERIGFVVGIGGYYDVVSALTFSTTGFYRAGPGEPWRHRPPDDYGKWVIVYANAGLLSDESDRIALWAMARRKMDDPNDDVSELVDRLGPEGRTVHALVTNDDPERVPELLAALPAPVRERFAGLDLSARDLSKLRARLILVHGTNDPMIPHTESRKLAAAAPRAELFIAEAVSHVGLDVGVLDTGITLIEAVNALLDERDRETPSLAALPSPE